MWMWVWVCGEALGILGIFGGLGRVLVVLDLGS